jgi:proprotein convertase subtilisin/kexin type 2
MNAPLLTNYKSAGLTVTVGLAMLLAGCGGGISPASSSSNTSTNTPTGVTNTQAAADRTKSPLLGQQLNEPQCGFRYTFETIPVTVGADPLLGQQWHLQNTGANALGQPAIAGEDLQVVPVWASYKGSGVRVAVVDDAIEIIHPDLAPNVVPKASYNFRLASPFAEYPLPCFDFSNSGSTNAATDDHGTAVAGIIVARDGNGIGGVGVSPRASLVAYNALSTETDADIADALTRDLANNAIVHNSWGSNDDGKLHAADPLFVLALNKGINEGRGGKGSIYVFPAGNGGCFARNSDGSCQYEENSNFDGYVNKLGQITVCSVGPRGISPEYAEPGANILVCAPATSITTTDIGRKWRPSAAGATPIITAFSGTSASAPMVSGVVALMLEANPNLTWRDVKLILAKTARKNHVSDPNWVSALGYNFNPYYGFGAVNATSAVNVSRTWSSVGNSSTLKTCGPFNRTVNSALPDANVSNRVRSDSVAIDASCGISKIEFVEVTFTASHTYSGDLQVTLRSPNGLNSVLAQARGCGSEPDACRPYNNWQFGSVRHLDESSIGNWTLDVSDEATRDTGSWLNWSIKFYGR